jgi:branched-chain amino acid transport system substrate-binding protein
MNRNDRTPADIGRRRLLAGAPTALVASGMLGAGIIADANNRASAASGVPIPIGSILPLTGAAAADGIGGQQGYDLAISEINEMGGILGQPIELKVVDSKNMSAEDVLSAANLLIDRDEVHAMLCFYNIGPNNAEYEPIADAGIIYIHANTLLQHQQTVAKDPDRYFGIFMTCGPEVFYGLNLIGLLKRLRDGGDWKPTNNKIAIASGSSQYSVMIAERIKEVAPQYGFEIAFSEVVPTPTTEWGAVLDKMRATDPAVIVNTHYFAGDLANFQRQFVDSPTNSLVYLQYGALLQSFADIAKEAAVGVITSSMTGTIPDGRGEEFIEKMRSRHGPSVNFEPAAVTYNIMYQYAIAASIAGGTGEPGNIKQNRRIAAALRAFPYRSVLGSVCYQPAWQCAQPYPAYTDDPSLGMPTMTFQIKDAKGTRGLISPSPYAKAAFAVPSWFK